MKVTIKKPQFQDGLSLVSRVVVGQTVTGQEYSSVLVSPSGNKTIRLKATDLTTFVQTRLTGKVEDATDSVLVVFKPLDDFVKYSTGDSLTLETAEETLVVRDGSARATIKTIDQSRYAQWPEVKELKLPEKLVKSLLEMMKDVVICASTTMVEPVLFNVHAAYDGKMLVVEAGDGHQYAAAQLAGKGGEQFDILVSVKSVGNLSSFDVERVLVSTEGTYFGFQSPRQELICRLSTGKFPVVLPNLPKEYETRVTVDRQSLLGNLQIAMAFADIEYDYRSVEVTVSKSGLEMKSSGQSGGSRVRVPISKPTKEMSTPIKVDARKLFAIVNKLEGERVSVSLGAPEDPIRVSSPVREDGYACRYYVWGLAEPGAK